MLLSRFLLGLALGFVGTTLVITLQGTEQVSRTIKGEALGSATCDGLVGYWSMDIQEVHPVNEIICTPSTIYHSAGGSTQWLTTHAPYPATNNRGSIHIGGYTGIDSGISNPSIFTWSAWVKFPTDAVPPNQSFNMIFSTEAATAAGGIRLYIDPIYNKMTMRNEEGYTNIGTNRALIPTSTWTHIAVTRSGDSLSNGYGIYVNGVRTLTGPTNTKRYNGNIWIGSTASQVPTSTFLGDIDDVRIYNRALSAAEILSLANGTGYTDTCSVCHFSSSSISSSIASSPPPQSSSAAPVSSSSSSSEEASSSSSSSSPPMCCNASGVCELIP